MGTESVFPGGKERLEHDADPSPPSSAVGHERVELYLYSPYRPHGLYRASVPVQGRPLPLNINICPFLRNSNVPKCAVRFELWGSRNCVRQLRGTVISGAG